MGHYKFTPECCSPCCIPCCPPPCPCPPPFPPCPPFPPYPPFPPTPPFPPHPPFPPIPRPGFAQFVNTGSQSVANTASLQFTQTVVDTSDAITLAANGTDITLAGGAAYFVIYKTQASSAAGLTFGAKLNLNGTTVTGSTSQAVIPTVGQTVELTSFAIITTGVGTTNTLNLVNNSGATASFADTNLIIVRL